MDHFGLIDKLRDYCTAHSWAFLYGNDSFANALADNRVYAANQKILVADFTCIPVIDGGKVQSLTYNGVLALGQKRETSTKSSLDETPIQKYDRRLKELSSTLMLMIGQIACDNELDVSNLNLKYDLNKFDLNADFVACSLNFIQ
jgi:hypothetical protein